MLIEFQICFHRATIVIKPCWSTVANSHIHWIAKSSWIYWQSHESLTVIIIIPQFPWRKSSPFTMYNLRDAQCMLCKFVFLFVHELFNDNAGSFKKLKLKKNRKKSRYFCQNLKAKKRAQKSFFNTLNDEIESCREWKVESSHMLKNSSQETPHPNNSTFLFFCGQN